MQGPCAGSLLLDVKWVGMYNIHTFFSLKHSMLNFKKKDISLHNNDRYIQSICEFSSTKVHKSNSLFIPTV